MGLQPSKYVDTANNTVVDNTGAGAVFLPSPTTTATILDKTTVANATSTSNEYTIALGVKADYTVHAGAYTGTFNLITTANPVTYSISYNANTEDTVTNMPTTQASETMVSSITLSNNVPEREHYSFTGWCSVQPTTDNGTDSCSGAVYNPNGDGTYLIYGIDQTTSNDTTLYAMWQIDTFTCTKRYRLENADGTWGDYIADGTETINYGGSCAYAKTVTDYKSSSGSNGSQASTIETNVTDDVTVSLDFYRNTYTLTVSAGSNTSTPTGSGAYRWGDTATIGVTKAANVTCTTYAAPTWTATAGTAPAAGVSSSFVMPKSNATVTATSAASNVAQTITLARAGGATGITIAGTSYTGTSVSLNCGTYNINGTIPDHYHFVSWGATAGTLGATNTLATTYQVTGPATLTLTAGIDTYTCTKRYRLQNADGTWGDYTNDGSETVGYGSSCSYSKTVTDYKNAANGTNGAQASTSVASVTADQTLSLDFYRNTYTLTVSAGSNTSSATGGGTKRWGETVTVGVTKATNVTCTTYATPTWTATTGTAPAAGASSTYTMPKSNATVTATSTASNVAQTITFKTTNATSITLNGTTKTNNQTMSINCGTYNLSGAIPANYHFSSWAATAGTLGATNTLTTTYQVTGAATITLTGAIDTYTQTTRYRYENADGTWGSWTTAESVSKDYGSSYSWSTSSITNFNSTAYQAASVASYTVTAAKTNDVNIYRKTFTCTKQYRLQNADGTYPSTYTAGGTESIRYGATCSYTTSANTTIYTNQTKSVSSVTAAQTISVDVPRKTFTCTKRYRLQNADGTFPSTYTSDGTTTAYYGGSCAYAKSVTDYKNAASGTNNAQASTTATNVTAAQTLSLDFYRNTYTLTVSAGTNTSSATGGGTKRWGETVTVGVTKAANVTCTTYATPTWTQSGTTGTFSATSGTSVNFTMGKGNATVTATSAASNVAQTITLSRSGGAASIVIAGTGYTGSSVSLNCGTYNISGTYSSGYEFSSWARANGVAVTSTTTASTTMTVTGAGTLTLNGKSSAITIASGSTTTMQSVYSKANGGCPSSLPVGTVYQLTDSRNGGYVYNVARLADGNCWMLDNLMLGNIQYEPIQLTPSDTNIASNWTLPGSISTSGLSDDNTVAQLVYNYKDSIPSTGYQGKTGVFYNFCAATAGTYCTSDASYWPNDSTNDICPKGWRLPTGGPSGEYAALAAAYNNDYDTFVNAFHAVLGGYYYMSRQNSGVVGSLWTSTKYSYLYHYILEYNTYSNGTLEPSTRYQPRAVGYPIRCILK